MPESLISRIGRKLASSSFLRTYLADAAAATYTSHGGKLTLGAFIDSKYAEIVPEGKNIIGKWTKISGSLSIGYASTIGSNCQLMGGTISIGRYCQFGPSVAVYAMNHPFTHLTSYVNQALFEGRLKQFQHRGRVSIGHDVWLGHGAIILPEVTIGNGAIVGAGAVVTRDVPEFTVVAGNPARILKKRFADETIELINQIKWWDLPAERLLEIEELFHLDLAEQPESMLEKLRSRLSKSGNVQGSLEKSG